jgi:hypothetical protein
MNVAIIVAKVAGINEKYGTIVLQSVRTKHTMIREHMHLLPKIFSKKAVIDSSIRIGDEVRLTAELSSYFSDGRFKEGLTNITRMERV